jgi:hypothetical protein
MLVTIKNYDIYLIQDNSIALNSVHIVLLAARFILFIDSYYFYLNMPRKTRHLPNKHLTSKLQFSPNFTLNSVADSNYRGKCDVGGFLIFEWTLGTFWIVFK